MRRRNRRKEENKMPKPWLRQLHGFWGGMKVGKPRTAESGWNLMILISLSDYWSALCLVLPRFSTCSVHQNLLAGLLTCELLSSPPFLILQVRSGLEKVIFKTHPSWWWHCWSENHTWRTRLLEILTLPGHQHHLGSFYTMPMPRSTPREVSFYRSDRGRGNGYVSGTQGDAKVQPR